MDARAITDQLGYLISLSIALTLLIGIGITAFSILDTTSEAVTQERLESIGHNIAHDIEKVDRLQRNPSKTEVSTTLTIPERLSGTQYTVELISEQTASQSHSNKAKYVTQCMTSCIVLYTPEENTVVSLPLVTANPVSTTRFESQGGQVRWNQTAGRITITPTGVA